MPGQDTETLHTVDKKELNLTFKSVCSVFLKMHDGKADLEFFGAKNIDEFNAYISWLNKSRWQESKVSDDELTAYLTYEEKAEYNRAKAKKNNSKFCILRDFDAYYTDFIEFYNIDLFDEEICYFKFNFLLNGLLIKESHISKRIEFRNYKPRKNEDKNYKKYMLKMKKIYSLNEETETNAVADYFGMGGVK